MIVLDTHVLAWVANDERKLGRKAKALIGRLWQAGKVAGCANRAALLTTDEGLLAWPHALVRHDARA